MNGTIDKDVLERALTLLNDTEVYNEATIQVFANALQKSWLTRQYFSIGKNSVVLPAWVLEQIGPKGNSLHGLAALPVISNSDNRNYFALGSPTSSIEPVVDHRGGIIPKPKSYTLMFGTSVEGQPRYMSEEGDVQIELNDYGYPMVLVTWTIDEDVLTYECVADSDADGNESLAINVVRGFANHPLFVTITPFDQEGLTEISEIEYDARTDEVMIANHPTIYIHEKPVETIVMDIASGHAGRWLNKSLPAETKAECKASLASWGASFPVRSKPEFIIALRGEALDEIDIDDVEFKWEEETEDFPVVQTSDPLVDTMFRNSAIVLRLLMDKEDGVITLGASLQEKVWPQALFPQILALDRLGIDTNDISSILNSSIDSLRDEGIFNDEDRLDAIGSIIYAIAAHYFFTKDAHWLGEKLPTLKRASEIINKSRKKLEESDDPLIQGLVDKGIPPFFQRIFHKRSLYFYHNFWAYQTMKLIGELSDVLGRKGESEKIEKDMEKFFKSITDSMSLNYNKYGFLTAGPYLSEDSLMILNISAFYPLKMFSTEYQSLRDTIQHIWNHYVCNGGLMIFQPWNAYGTYFGLQLMQVFRQLNLPERVLSMINFLIKNRTNDQGWGEGISPNGKSNSVGDSPNGYTAAEFVNGILDLFVDERLGATPVLIKGMPIQWLEAGVEAKQVFMEGGATINVSAKLVGDKLKISFKYTGEKPLIVHLPMDAKSVPPGLEQISTYEYQTDKKEGAFEFLLNRE